MSALTWEKALDEAYPVVKQLARKHIKNCNGYLEYADLLNAGLIGLHDAFIKYQEDSQASFKTYARFRINGAIIDEVRRNSHLSRRTFEKVKIYEDFLEDFYKLHGCRPSEKQIQEYLEGKVTNIKVAKQGRVYLQGHGGSGPVRVDETCPERSFALYELTEKLKNILPEKNYAILFLKNFEGQTLKEIAQQFDISEARVSQLIKESLSFLEDHLKVA